MKKLIFIFLVFMPLLGLSQSIGIKGGLTFSKMDLPFDDKEKFLVRPVLGLVYLQEVSSRFRIFIEPSYATKGVAENITFTDASGNDRTEKVRYKFSYIEVPILIGFNIINKDAYIGINVGAAPELLIEARVKSSSFNTEQSNTNIFGMDLILGAYAGYKLSGNIDAMFHFRYGKGVVSPIQEEDEKYYYFSPFITLNYKF